MGLSSAAPSTPAPPPVYGTQRLFLEELSVLLTFAMTTDTFAPAPTSQWKPLCGHQWLPCSKVGILGTFLKSAGRLKDKRAQNWEVGALSSEVGCSPREPACGASQEYLLPLSSTFMEHFPWFSVIMLTQCALIQLSTDTCSSKASVL